MKDSEFDKQLEKIKNSKTEPKQPKTKSNKSKKETKEMKKLSTKNAVIVSIISTLIVTGALVFGGFKLYEYVFNLGVESERNRQAVVVEQVAQTVQKLKLDEQ